MKFWYLIGEKYNFSLIIIDNNFSKHLIQQLNYILYSTHHKYMCGKCS